MLAGPTTLTSGLLFPIIADQTEMIGAEVFMCVIDEAGLAAVVLTTNFPDDSVAGVPVGSLTGRDACRLIVNGRRTMEVTETVRVLRGGPFPVLSSAELMRVFTQGVPNHAAMQDRDISPSAGVLPHHDRSP